MKNTAGDLAALPQNFRLDSYRIVEPISQGGFSIVYLAEDEAGAPVALKEYLPVGLARRARGETGVSAAPGQQGRFNTGLKQFFEESRILADIDHPNVVRVLNFFRTHGTACLVMRHERGCDLKECILRQTAAGTPFDEEFLRTMFASLLSGLREVHSRRLLHLDIKPANIFVRDDGHPVLLDFGAARAGLSKEARVNAVFTPGFAAPEQQGAQEPLGPWTDIYSVGASLYSCLAGETPQAADERLKQDTLVPAVERWGRQYSPQLLELIDWCLRLPVATRPPSVMALQKVLNGEQLDLVDPSWFDE